MIEIKPTTLREANYYVEKYHRHHGGVVGHKFSLAAYKEKRLVGVAIVGRPTGRFLDNGKLLKLHDFVPMEHEMPVLRCIQLVQDAPDSLAMIK